MVSISPENCVKVYTVLAYITVDIATHVGCAHDGRFIITYCVQNILPPPMTHNIISCGSIYVTRSWRLLINVTSTHDYTYSISGRHFFTPFLDYVQNRLPRLSEALTRFFFAHIAVLLTCKFSKHQRPRRQVHIVLISSSW